MRRLRGLGCFVVLVAFLAPSAEAVVLFGSTGNLNANGGGRIYTINTTTQVVSLVGNTGYDRLGGIDFDNSGQLWGATGGSAGPSSLIKINSSNGFATLVGAISGIQGVDALAFDASGTLYGGGWSGSLGRLLTINTSTGAVLTSVGMSGSGNGFVAGLDFDGSGQLYGSRGNAGGSTEDLVRINTGTGVHTAIGTNTAIISDIVFASDGVLYGSGTDGALYSINSVSGDKTLLFNTGINNLSGLTSNPVPEPGTLLLAVLGLLGMGAIGRKRVRR